MYCVPLTLLAATILRSLSDPPLRFATLPIRHIDQAGNTADQGILIAGEKTIGIGHSPQHLDDADTFFLAELPDDSLGKVMEIGRLDRSFLCRLDQACHLAALQAEAPGQGALDYASFANLDPVVAAGNFDKQHGKGEGGIVPLAGLTAVIDTGQKAKQPIEHVQFLAARGKCFVYQLVPRRRQARTAVGCLARCVINCIRPSSGGSARAFRPARARHSGPRPPYGRTIAARTPSRPGVPRRQGLLGLQRRRSRPASPARSSRTRPPHREPTRPTPPPMNRSSRPPKRPIGRSGRDRSLTQISPPRSRVPCATSIVPTCSHETLCCSVGSAISADRWVRWS